MSRPWIFGFACCCLLASSAAVGWGQEYLDLYQDPPQSKPTSLADKLRSLTGKFKRDEPQQKAAAAKSTGTKSASKSAPRGPRFRNTAESSLPAGRSQRRGATPAKPRPANAQPVTGGAATRSEIRDLLPSTSLFSRDTPARRSATQPDTRRVTPATNLPRAGSAMSQQAPTRIARKSPNSTRANELDAALADLLKPQVPALTPTANVKSTKSAARQSPHPSPPIASNSFDLRQALLDDEADALATEVAAATEVAVDTKTSLPVVKPTESKLAKGPVAKRDPVQAAPAVVAKPPVAVAETPVRAAAPALESTPPVATKPTVANTKPTATVDSKPIVLESVTAPVRSQQAITIAKPRPSPTVAAPGSPPVTIDPFEREVKQTFSTPQQRPNPMRPYLPATAAQQPVATIARPEFGVLQTSQQPVIVSHVEGPRSILVGREATYQVTLENTSNTRASNLSAEITVPEWAELVEAMSTSGVVERSDQGANAGALEWKLNELAPRSSQALRLRLIPRSGRPLHLGVRWSQAPVQSQAVVEVQEPKLEIAISGPQEVRFGKPVRYRLTLRNPGSGLTEQVSLRLVPPGGNAQAATTQQIGDLKPGEVRDIELELTAREAGDLLIRADALATGGLKAETTKTVLCRKPELSVDWRGPDRKYAGTVAAYYFRVQNPGTAATEPVEMTVKLPAGAEFVSASEGYSINTTTGMVSWRLAGIDVKEEQFLQLRCKIARPGQNDFQVRATTSDEELSDSKDFHTDVVALADLKLEVTDPQGPLPLGEPVVYEIRVRNRGTTDAENINIVGLFSEGIDPTTVEGAQFSLRDGRVSFHPLKSLPAGREVLLRIHAKANQAGTHTFRTEVVCPQLDIKLAAEETTRFFEDEHRWENGQTPYSAEREATLSR